MAAKEATVFIIDLGPTMAQKNQSRTESDLSYSMRYVWDKIVTIVATERKTLNIGVLAFNTANSDNDIYNSAKGGDEGEGYEHISVLRQLGQMKLADVHQVRKQVEKPDRKGGEADPTSAIVVAIQMISTFCRHLKYKRKIVLVTNGKGGEIAGADDDGDGIAEISKKLNEDAIELVVLGVDFDDEENFGFVEDPVHKDPVKKANEEQLKRLCEGCDNGMFATLAEAIDQLSCRPALKTVRPVASFTGQLVLGDLTAPTTGTGGANDATDVGSYGAPPSRALVIQVERYPRVMPDRAPTAGSYVLAGDEDMMDVDGGGDDVAAMVISNPTKLAAVKQMRSYTVKDSLAPGGNLDVPFEKLARGFEYGSTIVHISESDMNVVQLPTEPAMEIIGFVPVAQLPPYLAMSKSNIVVPSKSHFPSHVGFSSLLQALYQTQTVAIARVVPKKDKPPILVSLSPSIDPVGNTDGNGEGGGQCLIETELPFAEDVRPYQFPPLDRVYTRVKQEEDEASVVAAAAAAATATTAATIVRIKSESGDDVVVKSEFGKVQRQDDDSVINNTIGAVLDPDNADSSISLTRGHYLPTPELRSVMDEFIDQMSMEPDTDDAETDTEEDKKLSLMTGTGTGTSFPELLNSFNPLVHRYKLAIQARATDPSADIFADNAIPETPVYATKYSHPTQKRLDKAAGPLKDMIGIAGLVKVPPKDKSKWRKGGGDDTEPIDGMDLAEFGIGDDDAFDANV